MLKSITKLSFLPLALSILGACATYASSGHITILQPLTARIDNNAVAIVTVTPLEKLGPLDKDVRKAIQQLDDRLFRQLVSDGVFKQVLHETEHAKYYVRVRVTKARVVAAIAKFWLGGIAGSDELKVLVEVFEQPSNHPILEFAVHGESVTYAYSLQGHIDAAIMEIVDRIILVLMK